MEKQTEGKQPEKKFTTGAISATVWENQGTNKKTGEPVAFRTVALQRRYTDKEGKWQSTNSLRVNDLPKAALVIQKAYEYLVLKGQGSASDTNTATSEGEEIEVEDIVI